MEQAKTMAEAFRHEMDQITEQGVPMQLTHGWRLDWLWFEAPLYFVEGRGVDMRTVKERRGKAKQAL